MIELNVTNLVGGNIVITTGGNTGIIPETVFTLSNGQKITKNIVGTLGSSARLAQNFPDGTEYYAGSDGQNYI